MNGPKNLGNTGFYQVEPDSTVVKIIRQPGFIDKKNKYLDVCEQTRGGGFLYPLTLPARPMESNTLLKDGTL